MQPRRTTTANQNPSSVSERKPLYLPPLSFPSRALGAEDLPLSTPTPTPTPTPTLTQADPDAFDAEEDWRGPQGGSYFVRCLVRVRGGVRVRGRGRG